MADRETNEAGCERNTTDARPRVKALTTGTLADRGIPADCYVLEDGRRVLSQAGAVRSLTVGGPNGARVRGSLGPYLERLPEKHRHLAARAMIEIVLPSGGTALAIDSATFVAILNAYVDALVNGELKRQEHIARAAARYIQALAATGLDALIDEATGYQAVRAHDALSKRFQTYMLRKAAPWERMWETSVLGSLKRTFRLESDAPLMGVIGKLYRVILGEDVRDELKRRNTNPDRDKHHQFFTEELRQMFSTADLQVIKAISDSSRDKDDFWRRILTYYRRDAFQLSLGEDVN